MKNYAYYSKLSVKTKILNQLRKFFFLPFAEKFLLKKISGSKSSSFWTKFIPPEYLYPKYSWRSYERHGISLKLDISNVVDHTKYYGFLDKGFENFVSKLKDHYTVLDIGANIGLTCIEMAKHVKDGKVIAFEPSPSNFRRLQENTGLNNFKNIITVNKGIGDIAGTFKLSNVVQSNPGMKRILNAAEEENFESESITIDTLENQAKELNIGEVHAMKIDVEGYEMKVLESAAFILKQYKPVLFIELDDNNLKAQQSSAAELVTYLKGLGYEVYKAHPAGNSLNDQFNYTNCHFDIICK